MKQKIKEFDNDFENLNEKLLPECKGKIVAIELDSGTILLEILQSRPMKKLLRNTLIKNFSLRELGFLLPMLLVPYDKWRI